MSVTPLLQQAIELHRQGGIEDAVRRYREVLEAEPDNAEAQYYLAVAAYQQRKTEDAISHAERALALNPANARAHRLVGQALSRLGKQTQALASLDRAVACAPEMAEAHGSRADVLRALGRPADAIASYDRALGLNPNSLADWCNRGALLDEQGKYAEAISSYDQAIRLQSDFVEAHYNRANALARLERYEDALADYQRALAIRPDYIDALNNRGIVLNKLKRYEEALASFDLALKIQPRGVNALNNRGVALMHLKRLDQALESYQQVLALQPNNAEAWYGRGNVLIESKQFADALVAHDTAMKLRPGFAEAWYGRGFALFSLNRNDDALASYDEAIALKPDFDQALSAKIFCMDFSAEASIESQQAVRTEWWRRVGEPIAVMAAPQSYENQRDPHRRLVIGYVSADFGLHSAAFCIRPVLCNHDKSQVEVVCYSSNDSEDEVTGSFRKAADRWRDISRMSDEQAAGQIRSDRIDILVDLSGHTIGNRLKVFARKPAPVQVTAWGHATGTGLPSIDYLFSDPVMTPKEARRYFAEKVYDLPCCITTEPLPREIPRAQAPALKHGYCTFGVFNRSTKLSEESIRIWARILAELPRARLLLKDGGFDAEDACASMRARFAHHAIAADRLEFIGLTPRADHLATLNRVDICLDPFPQNGGVSTWEALRMGVPVVAKLGNTLPSRLAGAILAAVGMSEWVADDEDGYVKIAVTWARQVERLAELRNWLPAAIANSPAGDVVAYTRAVESAYRSMWRDYCASGRA